MMKEIQALLEIFKKSKSFHQPQPSAIATVVKTRGSVYRRPGAKMLLTASGQTIGAISGGCLEQDLFERAQPLMQHGQHGESPILVQYDTRANEDVVWGLGLGCNGVVQVLIESINDPSAIQSLDFIGECFDHQHPGAIATVFQTEGKIQSRIGDRLLLKADGTLIQGLTDVQLATHVLQDMDRILAGSSTQVVSYSLDHGAAEVLIERIVPPVPLLVFGAGYDALPVVRLAKQLGWHVTVIDHRPLYATRDRFPEADAVMVCRPDDLTGIALNSRTVAVVMTHHYLQDQALLKALLPSPIRYLGLLGPKRRTQQLLQDLQTEGLTFTKEQLHRLYGPIGLDLGAETPEEIALAILAEIQAGLTQRSGQSLRERQGPIHGEATSCLTLA